MQVGDFYFRKTLPEADEESVDYTVGSMLKSLLKNVAAKIGEDHRLIKEQLCTS